MDSFIVRIYRRMGKAPAEPAGTVERVGSRSRVGFAGRDQLLERLLEKDPPAELDAPAPAPSPSSKRR